MRDVHDLAIQAALCADAMLLLLNLQDQDASPTPEELAHAAHEAAGRATTLRLHLGEIRMATEPEQVPADGKRLVQVIKDAAYPFEAPLHGIEIEARAIGLLYVWRNSRDLLAEILWKEADRKALRKAGSPSGGWSVEAGGRSFPAATTLDLLAILQVLWIQAGK